MELHREQNIKEPAKIDLKSYHMACDYTIQDCNKLVAYHSVFNSLLLYNRYHETPILIFSKGPVSNADNNSVSSGQ